MGKTYSVEKKQEEVIIAQNGANGASTEHLETRIETYGLVITAMGVILLVLFIFCGCKMVMNKSQKWIKKQLADFQSQPRINQAIV